MAWDSKSSIARRRGNSSSHARQASTAATAIPTAKSAHVSDPFLQSFLDPSFDAVDYLNTTLPSLQVTAVSQLSRTASQSLPLVDLSAEVQTVLSQLNAHTTRLTGTLTQLTDEILRSGSRLAYEVELLRGETLGLAESLTEGLQEDVQKFVPRGIQSDGDAKRQPSAQVSATAKQLPALPGQKAEVEALEGEDTTGPADPSFITQLRTLTLVRSRLDSVIKTFGDAMEFVFPPSELSVSSSFLSVSAPEPGAEMHSTEEKGQQVLQKIRDEISHLLYDGTDPVQGIEKAAQRVEALKELSKVWKGTAEEKGRAKFIDSLAKVVEDRHRELLKELEQTSRGDGKGDGDHSARRNMPHHSASGSEGKSNSGGYSIISQLQRIRGGI